MSGERFSVIIRGGGVDGAVRAPPSKSMTQRAAVCALLSSGTSEIVNPSDSDDGIAAVTAAKMMGAKVEAAAGSWRVAPPDTIEAPDDVIDCRGSATTLRFFTAVAALASGATVLTGDASLRRRPVGDLLEALNRLGARCFSTRRNGLPPVVVEGGGIRGGETEVRGDISSQHISALILACTGAEEGTCIRVTTPIESSGYILMSLKVLEAFGGAAHQDPGKGAFIVPGRQHLRGCRYLVEGDYSSAAFMLAAGAMAGRVSVAGLDADSLQADRRIVDVIRSMGGEVSIDRKRGVVEAGKARLHGAVVDCSGTPDLVPVIGVLATQAEGETVLKGIRRLRIKESDRAEGIVRMINSMGGSASVEGDSIRVVGPSKLRGAEIDPSMDHRMAMAAAIAGLVAEGETTVRNAGCVSKSYRCFFDDLKDIGAEMEVVQG